MQGKLPPWDPKPQDQQILVGCKQAAPICKAAHYPLLHATLDHLESSTVLHPECVCLCPPQRFRASPGGCHCHPWPECEGAQGKTHNCWGQACTLLRWVGPVLRWCVWVCVWVCQFLCAILRFVLVSEVVRRCGTVCAYTFLQCLVCGIEGGSGFRNRLTTTLQKLGSFHLAHKR